MRRVCNVSTYQRKHIRYKPMPGSEVVYLDFKSSQKDDFYPNILGLVFSESYKGFGAIFIGEEPFDKGTQCYIRIGQIGPLRAEVRYTIQLDVDIFRAGLMYLD